MPRASSKGTTWGVSHPWGHRPTRRRHWIGPKRLVIWRFAKPLLRKPAPHCGQRGHRAGCWRRSANTASTRCLVSTRATCHAARINAVREWASSTALSKRCTAGSSSCMVSCRHSIGHRSPLEPLAKEPKSVPFFRCYASPPRTEMSARPREFLAATGLTHDEFARVLPAFAAAYAVLYPPDKTWEGKVRHRQSGGGAKGVLFQMEDKLLFILVYQKTNPLQTMHGLQCDLSQSQTNYWIHHLLPVLRHALAPLGVAPERDASRVATSPLALEGAPNGVLDGTERRRQRPTDAAQQKELYSGKKQTHTDKNLVL